MTDLVLQFGVGEGRAVTTSPEYTLVRHVVFKRGAGSARKGRRASALLHDHAAMVRLAKKNTRRLTGKPLF
jgi:hypothetical protein